MPGESVDVRLLVSSCCNIKQDATKLVPIFRADFYSYDNQESGQRQVGWCLLRCLKMAL